MAEGAEARQATVPVAVSPSLAAPSSPVSMGSITPISPPVVAAASSFVADTVVGRFFSSWFGADSVPQVSGGAYAVEDSQPPPGGYGSLAPLRRIPTSTPTAGFESEAAIAATHSAAKPESAPEQAASASSAAPARPAEAEGRPTAAAVSVAPSTAAAKEQVPKQPSAPIPPVSPPSPMSMWLALPFDSKFELAVNHTARARAVSHVYTWTRNRCHRVRLDLLTVPLWLQAGQLPNDALLALYAWEQQARHGSAAAYYATRGERAPSMLQMTASAQWATWHAIGEDGPVGQEAQRRFIRTLEESVGQRWAIEDTITVDEMTALWKQQQQQQQPPPPQQPMTLTTTAAAPK